jgi:hypothetical protein
VRTFLIIALFAATAGAADVDQTVVKELDRLERSLTSLDPAKLPNDLTFMFKVSRDGLDRARAAKTPLVRLYRLRQPFVAIESLLFFNERKESAADLARMEKLWNERRPIHEKVRAAARGSVLTRALQQAATNRGAKLFRASLPYAKVDSPFSGVYYLSEAEGNLRFSEFLSKLGPTPGEGRPDAAAIAEALATLEADAIALFEKDPVSRTAIPASAALKEARELFDQKLLEGSALLLLESQLELSKRHKSPRDTRGAPLDRDDSMTRLWTGIQQEEQGEVSAMIGKSVLPLYGSLFRSKS